jgi:hypothetical protein
MSPSKNGRHRNGTTRSRFPAATDRSLDMNPFRPFSHLFGVIAVGVAAMGILVASASAQTPPQSIPRIINPYAKPPDAMVYDGWLIFPVVNSSLSYDTNVFQSVTNPISTPVFRLAPNVLAVLNNGIYKTTLYGKLDGRTYSEAAPDTLDAQMGVSQDYSPRPDLLFRFQGDYSHTSLTSQFVRALPGPIVVPAAPTSSAPGNGPTAPSPTPPTPPTPTGPTGLSQSAPGLGTLSVDPSDQVTASGSMSKLFNRAFMTLGGSASYTAYETGNLSNYSTYAANAAAGFWITPRFYAYTQNSSSWYPASGAEAFRMVGGFGTDQIGLFRGSLYGGYQGSRATTGTAGGAVVGGQLSYLFRRYWTFTAAVDETWNFSSQTPVPTNDPILVLNTSALTPLAVPLSDSTRTTSVAVSSIYAMSQRWTANFRFGYLLVDYIDDIRVDTSLLADAAFIYALSRNIGLSFGYQYSTNMSNLPNNSFTRHVVTAGASYRF